MTHKTITIGLLRFSVLTPTYYSERFDTLDKPWFPGDGVRADIEWRQSHKSLGADDRYDLVDLSVEAVRSRGKSTFGLGLDFQTTLSFDGAVQDLFRLNVEVYREVANTEHGTSMIAALVSQGTLASGFWSSVPLCTLFTPPHPLLRLQWWTHSRTSRSCGK